jgi:tetratricopeptide (TPR) repeat protein
MTATFDEAARHYAVRDHDQAAFGCLEIIRSDPRHFDALHLLGVICTNRGQHADGVSYLLRAEALRPNDSILQANLGSAFGAVQRFDKAVDAYRRAITLRHRDAGLLNSLGLALQGLERRELAIETFRAALVLDPSHDPALYNLARGNAEAGHLAEAEADLRRLRARLPPDATAARTGELINELARVVIE